MPDTTESASNMKRSKEREVTADYLVTAGEAAAIMRVHIKTLRFWVRTGLIKKVPVGKRGYRIARSEIDRYIASREIDATEVRA